MKREFAEFLVATQRIPLDAMEIASGGDWSTRDQIGRLALMHGIIDPASIDQILQRQEVSREYFGQIAIQMGHLNPDQLSALLAGQAIRGCAEVLEDLILADRLSLQAGLSGLADFLSTPHFQAQVLLEAERGA